MFTPPPHTFIYTRQFQILRNNPGTEEDIELYMALRTNVKGTN